MIQLIATDMDGTLLDPEKQLPPQLPALLEELYRRDIIFTVASGRSHMALTSLFGDLAEETIFICDNGACVMQPHEAPTLHSLPLSVVHKVLDLCKELPHAVPVLCGFHHIYYPDNADEAMQQEISRFYLTFQKIPYEALYEADEPILKIAICDTTGPEHTTYPALHALLGDDYELIISGDCWMDIMCKGITKGNALKALQEQFGITSAATMAFGDYDNDISMLECAGFSYAMKNAPERIRKHAQHVAPSNAENGVVRVICDTLGIHMDSLRKQK